jgi:hypothetical protein
MRSQLALWPMKADLSQLRQAALDILLQIAAQRILAHPCQASNLSMWEALAFQPEDLHLLPRPGMGMMIPLIMQHLLLVFGEFKLKYRSGPEG